MEEGRTMKKKLVVYYAGEWAERLLTVSRCKDISYFVDEERTDVFSGGGTRMFARALVEGKP